MTSAKDERFDRTETMTDLKEIKTTISKLPPSELRMLSDWLQSYLDDLWEKQIEADLESGKLDRIITAVEEDIAANRVKKLNDFLYNA